MDELLKRVKVSCGYESQAAIARALDMSPQNFSSRKKSGGIKESLINLATGQGVNPEWLRTGQGEMRKRESVVVDADLSGEDLTPIGKAKVVLRSGLIYGAALQQNIDAFYEAVIEKEKGGTGHPLSGSSPGTGKKAVKVSG